MAGSNENELIKVLKHYEDEGNIEKLKAAEFLISNLPYNYSYDTTNLHKYRIVPDTYDSIKRFDKKIDLFVYINKFWDSIQGINDIDSNIYFRPVIEDIKVIKSNFLINNIEEAYASWKSNPYAKDSVSFEDFREYILPYRQVQGKSIENWRKFFKEHNKNHFSSSYPIHFTKACDLLFEQYTDYNYKYDLLRELPLLKFKDFMKIKSGKCTVKCWLNTYIVASEGIPMVIDFVPAWGTKEYNHEWNALVYGKKTIYFEPFWVKNNSWMYNNNMMNNLFEDELGGKVRLPKVYRNTFSTHIEGPISDKRVKYENIPSLFKNIKKIDVSDRYFKPVDVDVELTKDAPDDAYYAYLCVLGLNKQWIPVQWGKINNNKVLFSKMGTDIVYQPAYYENGTIIPCGIPFYLAANGKTTRFISENSKQSVVLKQKYPEARGLVKEAKLLKSSLVQAANRKDFEDAITLEKIDFEPELRPYEIAIKPKKKYRYYRIYSNNKISLANFDLFNTNPLGKEIPIKGVSINNLPKEMDLTTWIGLDLGKAQDVSTIKFSPKSNLNHVMKGLNYELFYVNKGEFISLGRKKADSYQLNYKNIPKNALLYLHCLDEGQQERIFEYKDGKQVWH